MSDAICSVFKPVTVAPSRVTGITEIKPCEALAPYVRCFWECGNKNIERDLRIIPDCCADIIIPLCGDGSAANFVGVCDKSFISHNAEKIFGIRFYGWAVNMFFNGALRNYVNASIPVNDVFTDFGRTERSIVTANNIRERVSVAEEYLTGKLCGLRSNSDVLNALYYALINDCKVGVSEMAMYCAASRRTLEREFNEFCGSSPKRLIDMFRYQLLWQACGRSDFDVLDCVERFGFYDCAHLYNNFKKFHGIGIAEALTELRNLSQIYNT